MSPSSQRESQPVPAFIWQVRVLWPEPLDVPSSCPNLPLPKDSFSMTLSARTLIPASSHSGCPTEPTATHLPTGISFSSFPQCKMANSGRSCIPLSTTAKRKEPMTQNPNCLSLGSNPSSPTSRLHRHTRNNPPEPWFAHLQSGDDIPGPEEGCPDRFEEPSRAPSAASHPSPGPPSDKYLLYAKSCAWQATPAMCS